MSVDARTQLAARQAQLVSALAGRENLPGGFDAARLQVAGAALAAKRRTAAARAWPGFAEALGDAFAAQFDAYAESHPLPGSGGPLADGRAFIRWLTPTQELPDDVRLQAFGVDLRCRRTKSGLVARRGLAVKMLWLSNSRRLVVGMRLPWFGIKWMTLRLWV